jgi:hypothetical protein
MVDFPLLEKERVAGPNLGIDDGPPRIQKVDGAEAGRGLLYQNLKPSPDLSLSGRGTSACRIRRRL